MKIQYVRAQMSNNDIYLAPTASVPCCKPMADAVTTRLIDFDGTNKEPAMVLTTTKVTDVRIETVRTKIQYCPFCASEFELREVLS